MTASADQEAELKLNLAHEDADRLEAAGLFPGEPRMIRQHAIYFDTPGRALSEAGLSLRIRKEGKGDAVRRVQTVKADGKAAGLFIRPEWERPVADDTPVIDHTTPIPALLGETPGDIAPVFTVENTRLVWLHEGIEITLDRSRIAASEREIAFCEIELELKHGDASALFALAHRIAEIVPVRLGIASKAERGYRLLAPVASASKAHRIALDSKMTAAEAFQAIAADCLHHFRRNEPLVLDHRDSAALHQVRVAIRRLRSALTVFKAMLDEHTRRALNGELRWLARRLGQARELDVLIKRAAPGVLRDRLLAAQERAYDAALEALDSHRTRLLMLRIAEWTSTGGWRSEAEGRDIRETPAREFAAGVLDRFRRKVKKSGRKLDKLDDHTRHEVRKTAKKLRYAVDFFAALFPEKREKRRRKRFVSALEELQDRLGALNDLAGAPRLLAELDLLDIPGAADLSGKAHKAKLLEQAAEAYENFVDAKRFWR